MQPDQPIRCIYKVQSSMREVKPEAYRPRMVLIGLHNRSKEGAERSSDPGHLENHIKKKYKKMEKQKKMYLDSFTERVENAVTTKKKKERVENDVVNEMKNTIQSLENDIRSSYVESTDWVSPDDFVEHILLDSVFIMELIMRLQESPQRENDIILGETNYTSMVKADLMLLENQLPYFIVKKLFGSVLGKLIEDETTVENLILNFFSLEIVNQGREFMHFTDMYRCAYEESLEGTPPLKDLSGEAIRNLENADNLARAGVKFKTWDQLSSSQKAKFKSDIEQPADSSRMGKKAGDYSLHVAFKKGCLLMSFHADDTSDRILRNVIAYEQCHSGLTPFTSNYIRFINFLITDIRDVEVLAAEGVLTHDMGNPRLVLDMVNKLNRGLKEPGNSQYHSIAVNLKAHYNSRMKRCMGILKTVYFTDLWKGTATFAGVLLLLLTLAGTVASIIQAIKSFK